ncbi:MAG: SufE family protein [Candidatus Methylacidiphilales bacterium]|nr:SufE family protein [Candidatus Methylacidiphilales bacterium]
MTARERAQELIESMNLLPDAQERFLQIISRGKKGEGLPEELKREEFRIEGCQSMLWLVPEFKDGICFFRCDSDAFITKGVASIMCQVYSGSPPREIVDLPVSFMEEAGITQHLSPNRSNGLSQLGKRIHGFAQNCLQV